MVFPFLGEVGGKLVIFDEWKAFKTVTFVCSSKNKIKFQVVFYFLYYFKRSQ